MMDNITWKIWKGVKLFDQIMGPAGTVEQAPVRTKQSQEFRYDFGQGGACGDGVSHGGARHCEYYGVQIIIIIINLENMEGSLFY